MKLIKFKAKNCFGFGESDYFILDSKSEFYTVLGRNSSGKTSLLNSISSLEFGVKPDENKRFKNFSDESEAYLEAVFELKKNELKVDLLINDVETKILSSNQISKEEIDKSPQLQELMKYVSEIYSSLFQELGRGKSVYVLKLPSGNFLFSRDSRYENAKTRLKDLRQKISDTYNTTQGSPEQKFIKIENKNVQLNFSAEEIENYLFKQFPRIYHFDKENKLVNEFPDRIKLEDLTNESFKDNNLVTNFISFLGSDDVRNFLKVEDPDKQDIILERLKAKAGELRDVINKHISKDNLLDIILSSKDGLQVTFKTEEKPSYYYQLSENTQLLFGYHLFNETYDFSGDVILIDEPNSGFHATVQTSLRELLKQLGKSSQVIITTHSEYMIDPDDLTGIKIMSKDKDGRLYVRNDFHDQPKVKGDYLALQPLMSAIGLEIGCNLNAKKRVVLTEGITDMYYLKAFRTILGYSFDLDIAPARGDSTLFSLIPLIISQGIAFKIVIDINSLTKTKNTIQKAWMIEDQYIKEIMIPNGFTTKIHDSGIEDLFTKADFRKLVEIQYKFSSKDDKTFENITNSAFINKIGKGNNLKRIIAFQLYINKEKYTQNAFDEETNKNFKRILDFCKRNTWKEV